MLSIVATFQACSTPLPDSQYVLLQWSSVELLGPAGKSAFSAAHRNFLGESASQGAGLLSMQLMKGKKTATCKSVDVGKGLYYEGVRDTLHSDQSKICFLS